MDSRPITKEEIEAELEKSTIEHRDANFSGLTLQFLSLAERQLNYGINLKDSTVIGNVFLADTVVNGNLDMENAAVSGS